MRTDVMTTQAHPVRIPAGAAHIEGDLAIPHGATRLVVFAHGSGSSRFSRRNRSVAQALEDAGCATLLLDLLTREEEAVDVDTREYRFDIPRLAHRVIAAIDWATTHPVLAGMPIACFGASTGAAAALIAAAARPAVVRAVISRGGRPDLAEEALPRVQAPTLLIVGGADDEVIELNRAAMHRMRAPVALELVPGATHLFEEPGALDKVTRLAAAWCVRYGTTIPASTLSEVPRSEWSAFLAAFSPQHRGWRGTLHRVAPGGNVVRIAGAALREIAPRTDASGLALHFTFATGEAVVAAHPTRVHVQVEGRAERALEVETADGGIVRLAFRTAVLPEQVDGLAPSEVIGGAPVSSR